MELPRFLRFLKPKPESPAEKTALERLDEETREAAWAEEDKETEREHSGEFGPLTVHDRSVKPAPLHHVPGDPVPEPVDDPDSAGGPSMHEDEPQP